jgi:hypothetical protein
MRIGVAGSGCAMSLETMEYMAWVIEIAAREFFSGSKTAAYDAKQPDVRGRY